MSEPRWRVEPADRIVSCAAELITQWSAETAPGRPFRVALSGGNTPRALFSRLASDDFKHKIDWTRWDIYWGDERCVPPDHADSNYRMAYETLISRVPLTEKQVHRIEGERDPEDAATRYGRMLKALAAEDEPLFDVVLLGMGDDGHTASLFPGTPALAEPRHLAVSVYVQKLNSNRVTLTARALNRARQVLFLVTGEKKAPVIRDIRAGRGDYPVRLIIPSGVLTWLIDPSAAG